MNPSPRRHAWPALLALAVAGCAVAPDRPETTAQGAQRRAEAPRPTYNLAGYPPAMRDGYIDGCESAKGSSYAHRDAQRIAGDRQYELGWNDGYAMCRAKPP